MKLERFDKCTMTIRTGEVLTLQEFTKGFAEYLIKQLEKFTDEYSKELKKALENTLGQKWSIVRKALDELDERNLEHDYLNDHDLSMRMAYDEIVYPATDQDNELIEEAKRETKSTFQK